MSEKDMEAIEIVAANLKEATEKAAAQLGVDTTKVKVTVLEETKGLFGKGQVRVRAEAKPETAKRKETKAKEPAVEPTPVAEPEVVEARVEKKPRAAKKEPVAAKEKEPEEVKATKPKSRTKEPAKDEQAEPVAEIVATAEDADKVVSVLMNVLSESDLQVSPSVSEVKGKYVHISLTGRDVSYLVGRRGEVLNALQYLMNVIVARQLESGVRVVIDGDNFRRRREEVLEKLALDIAQEVQKRGEEAVLDALPAFERRVIHQALSEFEGVVTYSEGEEPDRRVVIAPAEAV